MNSILSRLLVAVRNAFEHGEPSDDDARSFSDVLPTTFLEIRSADVLQQPRRRAVRPPGEDRLFLRRFVRGWKSYMVISRTPLKGGPYTELVFIEGCVPRPKAPTKSVAVISRSDGRNAVRS